MKVLSITAGAANMYCGSCLRDNALALALRKLGHDIILLPLYTPTKTDEANVSYDRVFFGGISVYLQQKMGLFRWTPKLVDRLWDRPSVIQKFAGRGLSVDAASLGALTVSVLKGTNGRQRKEIRNLLEWLREEPRPDLITLPYTLLISLARPLKEATGCPVVCSLQGEELFLEGLIEPWKSRALGLIREQVNDVDGFIAVSEYEARFMSRYLGIPPSRIRTVPLGISLEGHRVERRERGEVFRIGFFGRIAPEKGLHVLADAFQKLAKRGKCRLDAAGYLPPEHKAYLEQIQQKLSGLPFRYHGEVTREEKLEFLQGIDVFSMPCTYDEPKGLPLLEAMANGVPVVQPRRGSFPEIIEATGGGLIVDDLVEGIAQVWDDPALGAELGARGGRAVRERFGIARMAEETLRVYEHVAGRQPSTAHATR
ncbi:MAG: glycosyltransferase family 4 protein [Bryobacterales bacterium]|nr:glycosyltransferase family 4 protein [Bryobacterales bacterium]